MTETNGIGRCDGGLYGGKMKRLPYILITPLVFILPVYGAMTFVFDVCKVGQGDISKGDTGLFFGLITIAVILQFFLTSIPVVRRLNDAGKDRGLVGLLIIPFVNVILLLYLAFAASKRK